mmetsp:Transcript_19057/g.48798  ORF Transcript_19057/g.48798 Transcript_19057/m.48798 type:complete len:499 (-) Transcript_19057:309-1805(-)
MLFARENERSAMLTGRSDGIVSASAIKFNFIRMSTCFAINHGAVTAVLNLCVVVLGDIGSYMNGALYVAYAVTALCGSSAIVGFLGYRTALITGTAVYCVYVGAFPLVLIISDPDLQYLIAIGGGLIGGVAAGFLWTAQGAYFATSAKLYAEAHGDGSFTTQQATASLASLFGAIFLGFELLLKVAPLAIVIADDGRSDDANASAPSPPPALPPYPPHMAPPFPPFSPNEDGGTQPKVSDIILAVVYSICAIVSSIAMTSIWDLDKRQVASSMNADATDNAADPPAAVPPRPKLSLAKVLSAVLLWCKEPAVLLLAPVQVTFGFCAALLGDLVAHQVVPKAFPDRVATAAGCLSALVALIAALLQYPFSQTAAHVGKAPLMISGLLAFGGLATLCLLLDVEQLAAIGTLVSCYALQGVGRACYEGTNKALYADFFPNDTEAAFSNIVLANGIASAVGFFLFPSLANGTMASIALASAGIAIVGYLGAEALRKCKPTSF